MKVTFHISYFLLVLQCINLMSRIHAQNRIDADDTQMTAHPWIEDRPMTGKQGDNLDSRWSDTTQNYGQTSSPFSTTSEKYEIDDNQTYLGPTEDPPTTMATTTTTREPIWMQNKCTEANITVHANKTFAVMLNNTKKNVEEMCSSFKHNSSCVYWVRYNEIDECLKQNEVMHSNSYRDRILARTKNELDGQSEPPFSANWTLEVRARMVLLTLDDFSDFKEMFNVRYFLKLEWTVRKDFCAVYLRKLCAQGINHNSLKRIKPKNFHSIWIPDIQVMNLQSQSAQVDPFDRGSPLKFASIQVVPGSGNRFTCNMELKANYDSQVKCTLEFSQFPHDTQYCNLTFKSSKHNSSEINLLWSNIQKKTLGIKGGPPTGQFEVSTRIIFNYLDEKNFSIVGFEFKFKRITSKYFVTIYFPSLTNVLASMSTFWLPVDATSDRVTMGSTCVIALIYSFIEVSAYLPPSNSVSRIGIWLIFCFLFVTFQMVESIVIKFILEKRKHDFEVKTQREGQNDHSLRSLREQRRMRFLPYNRISPEVDTRSDLATGDSENLLETSNRSYFDLFLHGLFLPDEPFTSPEYLPGLIDRCSRTFAVASFILFVIYFIAFLI